MIARTVLTLAVAGLLTAAVAVPIVSDDYEVTAVMPASHPKLREGSPVYVNGFETGEIVSLRPEDNKALLTLRLDDAVAPLHSGATVRLRWKSLVGERVLFVDDGDSSNPPVPDDGRIEGNPAPTEVSDILERLGPKTREHMGSLITRLEDTLDGSEQDMQGTLRTAGPALAALGNVLRAVGSDGPAIRSLVTNMNRLMAEIENRSDETQRAITALSRTANAVAGEREQLRQTLVKLPTALRIADSTLTEVPSTTDGTVPLLRDVAAATERLPSTATNMSRLFRELRPTVADLKPTLRSASTLLDRTPALLGSMHATVPDMTTATRAYLPALEFLRPYTPEAVGFLTTWGSAAQNYDANGRYMRIHFQEGGSSVNANPGVPIPGIEQDTSPAPDAPGGIPQDAAGEGMN